MSPARKVSAAVVALAFALGVGTVVQTGGAAGTIQDRAQAHPPTAPLTVADHASPPASLEAPAVTLAAVRAAEDAGVPEASQTDHLQPAILRPAPDSRPSRPRVPEAPCVIRSSATSEPGAVVRLRVSAICLPDSRVTVHHNGMLFTDRTDAHGMLEVVVPATAERAIFMLTFAGEQMAMALAHVPDIADYDRVVLQWQGHGGFELHAREFGAAYGMPGHVWGGADNTDEGRGGHVTRLGNRETDAPMMAEVYSFPAATSGSGGRIDLSVEVRVSERNCGREIEAQTLQLGDERRLDVRSLVLAVPGCDAIGDNLVLNNVFEDLKIAAR